MKDAIFIILFLGFVLVFYRIILPNMNQKKSTDTSPSFNLFASVILPIMIAFDNICHAKKKKAPPVMSDNSAKKSKSNVKSEKTFCPAKAGNKVHSKAKKQKLEARRKTRPHPIEKGDKLTGIYRFPIKCAIGTSKFKIVSISTEKRSGTDSFSIVITYSGENPVRTVIAAFANVFYHLGGQNAAFTSSDSGRSHNISADRRLAQSGSAPDTGKAIEILWDLCFPAYKNTSVRCRFSGSYSQHLSLELSIMTPEPLDPYLFFYFIMDALAKPKYLIEEQNTQTIRTVAASDLILKEPDRKREFASKEAAREDLRHRFVLTVLEDDKLDYTGERFEKRFQLDQERLFFLTVYYTAEGICDYSIDVEKADDSHYALSAEAGEQLRLALDPQLTLWEGLMLYLEDYGEGSLLSLMNREKIKYSGTHYVFWGDWDDN